MIIDLILDRKDGRPYTSGNFYRAVNRYHPHGVQIADALEGGEEADVKKALCNYIKRHDYNPAIKKFINSVTWL